MTPPSPKPPPRRPDEDFVSSLGRAFLAHRLKRAAETLREGYGAWLPEAGVLTPVRGMSTVLLLERGPRSITETAEAIGFSHPFMIRLLADLERAGLVRMDADTKDRRRRVAFLTEAGREEAARIRVAARAMEAAFAELSAGVGTDLLALMERLEAAERALPFSERVRRAAANRES